MLNTNQINTNQIGFFSDSAFLDFIEKILKQKETKCKWNEYNYEVQW